MLHIRTFVVLTMIVGIERAQAQQPPAAPTAAQLHGTLLESFLRDPE